MSRGTPDISEWIRLKKIASSINTDTTLAARKNRLVGRYKLTNPSLRRMTRLPINSLRPLKIVAPHLLPIGGGGGGDGGNQNVAPSSPSSITFGTFATFSLVASWPAVSGATSYTLRVYESTSDPVTVQNSTVIYTFDNAVSGSTFQLINTIDDTKNFAVGVTANNQYGSSDVRLSSTKRALPTFPPTITLTKPVSDGMVVTWSGAARAVSYTVRVYTSTTSSVTDTDTLVNTYTSATSGSKFEFTPVDGNYYTVTIASINEVGEARSATVTASYVRYVLTNTADYNYQFKLGNIQPTTLHGATAYDTGNANSWVIRLKKVDYDGDTLTSVLTTALSTAGTVVLSNIANANQKLTFTVASYIVNAYDHFEIVGTKDGANSTSITDDTIVKVTVTAEENPPAEYVFSATTSMPSVPNLVNDPGSGNVKFQPVIGNAKINLAISKTNKAGTDLSTWHTDNGTVGKIFRLRLVSDQTLLNFTAVIEDRTDRTTHWEYNLAAPSSQTPPAGQQPSVSFPADVNIALF
jgi:hypothetical protein